MNSSLIIACVAVLLSVNMAGDLMASSRVGRDRGFLKWPLKNGDFSTYVGGGHPAHWSPGINRGKFNFKREPITPLSASFPCQPSVIAIEAMEAGECYYYQVLPLMKGDYQITVEVSGTPGVRAQVTFSSGAERSISELMTVEEPWRPLQLDVSTPGGDATIGLLVNSPAGHTVRFRKVKLETKSLSSSPIPFEDGTQLGGLVLPDNPSLAEQFACYELQRYLFKMTGLTPGLKGRDQVYEGERICLGRAAHPNQLKKLERLPHDSYLIRSQGKAITLAGKTDQGTLYAVYDFLSQQGCRWIIPGDLGEVIPTRKALLPCKDKTESPDYDCRGLMVLAMDFFPGGGEERGWYFIDVDEYFDWALRNRLNALWFAEITAYDFGEHRGHGWSQLTNHSYNNTVAPHQKYFQKHPEWYALVKGKRMPVCDLSPYFVNQLCVSSRSLRDYTVNLVREYFKNNPKARAFPLNPMDGPVYWCECDECKKLDPPGLDWSKNTTGNMAGMTDRALNYANEVADRVSKVYPDKLIEMYAYSYTIAPPVKEKVHQSVMIKYANLSYPGLASLGRSMLDTKVPGWTRWREQLQGWKMAGARHLFLYNYFDWVHPDVSLFWFYSVSDLLKILHRDYSFRGVLGETETNPKVSVMLYQVLARTLWNVNTDYQQVIRDVCDHFYGPVAEDLYHYNLLMDKGIIQSTAWQDKDWRPIDHLDLSLEILEKGREILEHAAEKVKGDRLLSQRLAYARFGHAYLTYVRALSEQKKTTETAQIARQAFDQANSLRSDYGIMAKISSVQQLNSFYYPPVVEENRVVMELPVLWDFKTDPSDVGAREKWFEKKVDSTWVKICTSEAWTSQAPGRGYHGTAWYHISFDLPLNTNKAPALALHFGAVDGYADVYLDGLKIGEQKAPPDVMWDKPFSIVLPGDMDTTKTHQLMVRVRKDNFAAGLWKTAKIVRGDSVK